MASSGYAPGWLADYATVASALKANYSAVAPFEASDVVIGITYLRDQEREKRAASGPDEIHRADAEGVLGPGPSASELLDLRKLCVAVEASYLEDRASVAAAIAPLGHAVVVSKPESKFQQPAYFVSRDDATGDVHLVVRGTASLTDALTDMDCDAEPLFADGPTTVFRAHRDGRRRAVDRRRDQRGGRHGDGDREREAQERAASHCPRAQPGGHRRVSRGDPETRHPRDAARRGRDAVSRAGRRRVVARRSSPPSCSTTTSSRARRGERAGPARAAAGDRLARELREGHAKAAERDARGGRRRGQDGRGCRKPAEAHDGGGGEGAVRGGGGGEAFSKDGKGGGGKVAAAAGAAAGAASGAATAAAAAAGSLASRFGASFNLGGAKSAEPAARRETPPPPSPVRPRARVPPPARRGGRRRVLRTRQQTRRNARARRAFLLARLGPLARGVRRGAGAPPLRAGAKVSPRVGSPGRLSGAR